MKHALLLLALIATQAQAQIIYTDVNPDQLYNQSNDTCLIDLDDDGQLDLRIRYVLDSDGLSCSGGCTGQMVYPRHFYVDPMPGNQIADSAIAYVNELSSGDAIDGSLLWGADAGQILIEKVGATCFNLLGDWICSSSFNGNWGLAPPATGFVGVQFLIGGQIHYGWVRLRVQTGPGGGINLHLLDYAYNSVPGEPILAGESLPTSIARIAQSSIQVSPNPFTSTLIVSLGMKTAGVATSTVRALTGQAIITRTAAATSGPSSITLDLASLAPGTYLLEMETDGERIVRKVVKE